MGGNRREEGVGGGALGVNENPAGEEETGFMVLLVFPPISRVVFTAKGLAKPPAPIMGAT